MIRPRAVVWLVSLAVLAGGCSSSEMSLTEYAEVLNALEDQASARAEQLAARAADLGDDVTPQDVQEGLELARTIRLEIKEVTDGIDPPAQIADLHNLMFDWHTKFISVEEALAARAGTAADTAADWEALSDSPEMEAYRDALAEGKAACDQFQARLDATEARGGFADNPWVPGELSEVVKAAIGCQWFPERPEDVYRYPPVIP